MEQRDRKLDSWDELVGKAIDAKAKTSPPQHETLATSLLIPHSQASLAVAQFLATPDG